MTSINIHNVKNIKVKSKKFKPTDGIEFEVRYFTFTDKDHNSIEVTAYLDEEISFSDEV